MNNLLNTLLVQVENNKNFQAIMADQIVSESEIMEQSQRVEELIAQIEKKFSEEDFQLICDLLTEVNVLYIISQYQNKF